MQRRAPATLPDEPEFSLENCHQCLAVVAKDLPVVLAAVEATETVDPVASVTATARIMQSLKQLNWMMNVQGMKKQQLWDELWAIEKGMLDSGLVSRLVDLTVALLGASDGAADRLGSGVVNDLMLRVLMRLLCATDRSLDFCLSFAEQDKFFRAYYPRLLNRQDGRQMLELATAGLVECTIGIAYNVYFKDNSDLYRIMSEYELVDCTKPYLTSPVTRVSATALIFTAFAVDEGRADFFLGVKKSINYLISILRLGLKSPERGCDGYTVLEMSKIINRLAINDANKDLLIELNVLSVVKLMLDSSSSQDVQEGLEILFTLSFSEKNAKRIWADFRDYIERLGASEQWKTSQQLRGLQFRLNGQPQQLSVAASAASATAEKPSASSRRVMISYNHASKQQVAKLYRRLTDAQVDVWVDFEHLREGSTLDAMSEAVESSRAVLLCVTRLYKESNNCRLEAEYAWKCNKKLIPLLMEPKYRATGWLGILMGTQLYFDLTETKCTFEDKFSELLPVILGHLDPGVAPAAGVTPSREHRMPTPPPPLLPPILGAVGTRQQLALAAAPAALVPSSAAAAARSWDADRVAAWCRERQLSQRVSEQRLTGRELHFLLGAMAHSPEFFGRLLERYFGFERLHDMAAFVCALEELRFSGAQ